MVNGWSNGWTLVGDWKTYGRRHTHLVTVGMITRGVAQVLRAAIPCLGHGEDGPAGFCSTLSFDSIRCITCGLKTTEGVLYEWVTSGIV